MKYHKININIFIFLFSLFFSLHSFSQQNEKVEKNPLISYIGVQSINTSQVETIKDLLIQNLCIKIVQYCEAQQIFLIQINNSQGCSVPDVILLIESNLPNTGVYEKEVGAISEIEQICKWN